MQHIAEVNWMFVGILLAIALAAFVTWAVERVAIRYLRALISSSAVLGVCLPPAVFNRCVRHYEWRGAGYRPG